MLYLFLGIQTATVYWPAKVLDINRVIMFKLQFWDAGENALKKFDHILPVRLGIIRTKTYNHFYSSPVCINPIF